MAYVAPHNSLSRTCGLGCSFIDGIRGTPSRREAGVSRYPFLRQPCSGLVRPLRRLSAARPCGGLRKTPFLPAGALLPGLGQKRGGCPPSWLSTLVRISSLAAAFAAYHPNPASGRKPALGVRPEHAGPLAPSRAIAECPPSAAFFFRWASPRCRARNAHLRKGQAAARRLHACAPAAGYPPPGNGASGYCFFPLLNA